MKALISILLHLRLPFSFLLMPIYFFSLSISPNFSGKSLLQVWLILHVFLYPASNAYNSYFDKDEGPIGGLKRPPKVNKGVYLTALLFDIVAVVLAFLLHPLFAAFVFVYGIISKMYSHPSIRLKKYPISSWLIVGLFQGFFTFLMIYVGLNSFAWTQLAQTKVLIPALLSSLFLWGSYPLTQVYQHKEDNQRGDHTLSIRLGIKGTFIFSALFLLISTIAYIFYFYSYFQLSYALHFLIFLSPVALFYFVWMIKVWQDEKHANYTYTMAMNWISALCLNAFFIYFFLYSSNLVQLF